MRRRLIAGLALAFAGTAATAQTDPFGALHPAAPGEASSGRMGSTSVTGAVGRSYAGAQAGGLVSLAQLDLMPADVAPIAPALKVTGAKYLAGRRKIAVPTYALAFVRGGEASAFSAGAGSSMAGRRTKIATRLVGLSEAQAAELADAAYRDLVAQLTAAGFEVVGPEALAAAPHMASLSTHPDVYGAHGPIGGGGTKGWVAYPPKGAPLIKGYAGETGMAMMSMSRSLLTLGHVSKEVDAVLLLPRLIIDYVALESTGRRNFVGSAQVGAELEFGLNAASRTDFIFGNERGGAMPGAFTTNGASSPEPFGIMAKASDRSDSVALHNALAVAGFGSVYRQSLVYDVEVSPKRFAALTRAAYQGYNAALVAEIRRARGGG